MQTTIMKTGMICTCAGLLVLFGCSWGSAQNRSEPGGGVQQHFSERDIIDVLLEGYERRIRPGSKTGVIVLANLLILSIAEVDNTDMDFAIQMTFSQEWNDYRLAYDSDQAYVSLPYPKSIWRPDIFFLDEKSAHLHNVVELNDTARIYPDGNISMSTRISVVLVCPMDQPTNRQICEIRFASYGSKSDDFDLVWKQSPDAASSPVQLAPDLSMHGFTLAGREVGQCTAPTGSTNCLKVSLLLQRNASST